MDIAKYIGLFLLKNSFCYLHGLGNLELKKKPAAYDGDALHAPEYDVVLTSGGSIDDTLANYIATHEQTSISKAANALREFSTATKAEIAAGKEVELPGIGRFIERNGMVGFIADPHLKHVPPPVPMLRMSKRLEEKPDFRRDPVDSGSDNDGGGIAWGKVGLVVLLLAVVIAGVIFGIRYFNNRPAPVAATDTVIAAPVTTQPLPPQPTDTAARRPDTALQAPVTNPAPAQAGGYTIVLNTYPTRGAADKRAATLKANGNEVAVISRDSANYLVTTHVAAAADTTRMLDSLRRFFNPKGVYILK